MDPGSFFILLLLLVAAVGGAIFFAINGTILGRRGSDPERQLGDQGSDPDERPRHTRVDLEQNKQDAPRGEPVDRVT
jgi:hypothetical protein